MAEKDRKPDVPVVPGQVYIEVEYDYEYEAKDRTISIKEGERYILLKKTNNDWWQVKKDDSSKPFYLPAQYVKELPRKALMPPVKRVPSSVKAKSASLGADAKLQQVSNENVSKSPDYMSAFKSSMGQLQIKTSSENQTTNLNTSQIQNEDQVQVMVHSHSGIQSSVKVGNQSHGHGEGETQYSRITDPNRILAHSQDFDAMDVDKLVHEHSSEWTPESSEKHQDSESGDECSSSSTEQLQTVPPARSESPVYANLQELKISQANLPPIPTSPPMHIHGEWEVHKDNTGRTFYYHKGTQERSWKPPRWTRDSINKEFDNQGDSLNRGYHITEENCRSFYSSHSDNQFDLPPRGWSEELDDRGQTLYVNEYTNEKWMKHIDDQGRPYYYRADGSKSEWELPQYNVPAKQEVISKSRSLDRKPEPLVLTNWRHSTYGVSHLDLEKFTSKKHKRNSSEHLCAPSSHLFSQHPDQELATSPKLIHDNNNEPPSSPKSPQPSPTVSEKYGLLYMTKITENGKKVRKNWTSSWTVLQGSSLLFAKNQGSGTGWKFGNTQSKPEFTVDLKGAAIEWASKDKSSKKNVIELRTRQGTELLIQLDNDNLINEWYKALEETISSQTESDEDDMPESPVIEKQDKDKNNKDLKKSRPMKSSSNVDNADQKKTKTKLKKFLTRRPTLQAVRDKGYIKDQVFGCNLNSLCQREGTTIPKFVTLCIDHVEKEGLNIDGLYRVSGNLAVIQKLRFAVNHDEKLDLKDNKWEDINVITGALKMFFRELPEPLFTYHLFNDFINAIKSPDYKLRIQGIKELVRQLPKPNHDTMQVLFKHLVKVIACGELNRMTTQSVAIVFGPTLLRPEKEVNNIAVHMVYQNQIVELILTEIETIFGRS
ncbi:rho GTPase-activating protein 12b isoform X1 [Hypanus sabinus]|uniref:rho GTPase-activating protein 12b isoform X1 n=1 Tax=Hypanus sabinus TaxID=79690 RepID=UPI0028C42802|nr:rho GTPase-activating protein 12b isoform X1 [Hypanus sabinus]XP_059827942.1 rho GTPase-activating protein 12b isoform X1 [Hypanus sabinus]